MRHSRHRLLVPAGVLFAFILAAGACNYHWYPFGTTFQLRKEDPLQFVAAVPAKKNPDTGIFEPVCTGEQDASALLLYMNILGTQQSGGSATSRDKDVSMRPGDILKVASTTSDRIVLKEGDNIRPDQLEVNIKCLEPYPDPDITGNQDCQGQTNPGVGKQPSMFKYLSDLEPDAEGYYPRPFGQEDVIGVALLIDQSGSMKGLVDEGTAVEVKHDMQPSPIPDTFSSYGSDPDSQRLTAARVFLESLNPKEKSIVFKFSGEIGPSPAVVCYNPDGLQGAELLDYCYSTDRGKVLDKHYNVDPTTGEEKEIDSEISQLQPEAKGRTPLWQAVSEVYDFMSRTPATQVRHIVVIDDGPDTCAESSPDFQRYVKVNGELVQQGVCSGVGYEEVRDKVLADLASGTAPKVHIHFVQFQARAYKEHDPRQQELACLTGGHYIFVNAEDLSKGGSQPALETALKEALLRIRYSLAGTWGVAVELPGLYSEAIGRGLELAIQGDVKHVGQPNSISLEDQIMSLRVGKPDSDLPNLDLRAVIRIPCSNDTDCGWMDFQGTECQEKACLDVDAVCGARSVADDTKCTDGVCCIGNCETGLETCKNE